MWALSSWWVTAKNWIVYLWLFLEGKLYSFPFFLKYWRAKGSILVRVSTAVKRHHASQLLQWNTFNWGSCLQFQRVSPLSLWWGVWQCASRHAAEEGAATWTGSRLSHWVWLEYIWALKACLYRDTLPPTKPLFLIMPLLLGTFFFFQTTTGSFFFYSFY